MKRLVCSVLLSLFCLPAWAMEWQWLDDMRLAMQQLNYRGEFIVRRGDISSAYSVVHRYGADGQVTELLRQLDGDMIEVLRNGKDTVCYYPQGSGMTLSHAIPAAPFSQITQLDLKRISENYMVSMLGEQRVAGYVANVILLRGDEWRYQQRLWLEKDTQLLLQSEIIGPGNQILEQFRFTRLEIAQQIDAAELVSTLEGTAAERRVVGVRSPGQSDESHISKPGWLPAGAVQTYSERRPSDNGWLEMRSFSDGLASFSVFVEAAPMLDQLPVSQAQAGATTAFMTYRDGLTISVVGEVPQSTARKLSQELLISKPAL